LSPAAIIRSTRSSREWGLGLIELLVALAIGALAIAGTISACVKARQVQAALDSNARLQETARYALAIVESDLRMAGFWGLVGSPANITASTTTSFPAKCGGAAWITPTPQFVDGSNNAYLTVPNCNPSIALRRSAQPCWLPTATA
jgi:type IV pilus assembly protein PilW